MRAISSSRWKGLVDIVVGAEAERADLGVHLGNAREDQNRRLHLGDAQLLEHVIAVHVGKVEVEQDDVVIIQLAEIEAFFAEIGCIDIEAFGGEHKLNRLGRGRLVLDQQHAHGSAPYCHSPMAYAPTSGAFAVINHMTNEHERLIYRKRPTMNLAHIA
jgi:hypothetical protein